MGSVAGPDLAAEVSRAGGLGVIGGLNQPPEELRKRIRFVRERTDRPFGLNLWLHAEVRPAMVSIEYKSGPLLCAKKPDPRRVSDFIANTADRDNWLQCTGLSFAAPTGTLGSPIEFGITASGEDLSTPYRTTKVDVTLPQVNAASGSGICSEAWLSDRIVDEIELWQSDVESTIGDELVEKIGEEETLKRLLSPFELGIPWVHAPPVGTPSYDVHPLATYDLTATIDVTHGVRDQQRCVEHGSRVPQVRSVHGIATLLEQADHRLRAAQIPGTQ